MTEDWIEEMKDTQWPRWEVFKQDTPKKPHQAVGSIHGVDPEHALLAARNVFVRRPRAVSLWVALAADIFAKTAEELAQNPAWYEEVISLEIKMQSYTIFRKASHRRTMTFADHVGDIKAKTPKQALLQAIETFCDLPALAWWVIPAAAIVRSEPDVVESWFAPAQDKTYKQQSEYGLISVVDKRSKFAESL